MKYFIMSFYTVIRIDKKIILAGRFLKLSVFVCMVFRITVENAERGYFRMRYVFGKSSILNISLPSSSFVEYSCSEILFLCLKVLNNNLLLNRRKIS